MWSPLPRNKIAWLSPQGEENACGVLALISMQFIPQPKGWGFLAWIMLRKFFNPLLLFEF